MSGPRVFLSYGHRDATDLAVRLRSDLETAGYAMWQDERQIRAGHAWTDEIRDGLRQSDLVVALLSPHAVRRAGWGENVDDQDSVCLDEIEYAVDACKIPVLPVMAVSCEPPFRIFRLQYLDFRAWQESAARYDQLKNSLLSAVADCLATGRAPLRKWDKLPDAWDFTAFLAERRRRFFGRRWLFNAVREKVAEAASPIVLLTASPGFGKSAFIASLIHENPQGQILAYHCCQATTPATLSPAVFVRSVAAMMAARDPEYAGMLEHADTLAALDEARIDSDPASAYETLILNPLQKLPQPPLPRLIVIDALDEALGWPRTPNLLDVLSTRLGALPSWLRIVATTRDESAVLRRFRTATVLRLDPANRDNADDLRHYIKARLEAEPLSARVGARRAEAAEKVFNRGSGNFLVVEQTLDALASGLLDINDLDSLAPGLEPLYGEFFDRLYARAGVDFAVSRPLLQCIVAAERPPSRSELAEATGLDADSEIPGLLGRLASFFPPRDARYTAFHKTLEDWLTGWNATEDQPVAGPYFISRRKGHERWADAMFGRYTRAAAPWDAGVRHDLPTHLLGAERWDDAISVLLDLRFLEVSVQEAGTSIFDRLADFTLALAALPQDHARRKLVFLVSEILRLDAPFIAEFPESLFQCLWNRGHWHDGPNAKDFLSAPAGTQAPWEAHGVTLHELVEGWRREKEQASPGFIWLRALRPPPETLGSAQRGFITADADGFAAVAVSPDGRRVIGSMPEDGRIGVWDVQTCASLAQADFTESRSVHSVRFFSKGPHSGLAAAVTWDGRLIVLDDTLQSVDQVQASDDSFGTVAVSPDGELIATGDWKGVVGLWEAKTLSCRHRWAGHEGQVTALEFSPCGRYLATGDHDEPSMVRVWSLNGTEPQRAAEAKARAWVESLCFAADGAALYWGDYHGAIERWIWRDGLRTVIRNVKDSPAGVVRLIGDGRLVCGVGGASELVPIEVWNLATVTIEQTLRGHLFGVGDIAVVPGTQRFVSAGDSTLRVWDLGVPDVTRLNVREPEVSWIAFREPQGWTITATETGTSVWLRRLDDGAVIRTLTESDTLTAIALAPDGNTLACGLSDGHVSLWDLDSGTSLWQLKHHQAPVGSLAFSDDRETLASGGEDGRVHVIEAANGRLVRTYKGHKGDYVQTLAFSHDGRLVASGGLSSLRVWQAANLKLRFSTQATHYALWFTPDDRMLIAQAPGEAGIGWNVTTGKPVTDDAALAAAYEAATLRSNRRWTWDISADPRPNQTRLTLIDRNRGSIPVARYPEVRGFVQWHPSGRVWTNMRSRQLSLVRLEGA